MDWFGLIFAGFGSLFLFGGLGAAHVQARRRQTYLPVPATIVSSDVLISSDSDGAMYSPNIKFVYHAGGQARESTKALMFQGSTSSRSWAEKIVERFPVGMMTHAYVHPTKPDKVFLLNEVSIFPYAIAFFSMIFVTVGIGIALSDGAFGWSEASRVLATALLWNAIGAICLAHYRWSGGKLQLASQLLFMLYAGIGLIMLVVWDDYRDGSDGLHLTGSIQRIEKE